MRVIIITYSATNGKDISIYSISSLSQKKHTHNNVLAGFLFFLFVFSFLFFVLSFFVACTNSMYELKGYQG